MRRTKKFAALALSLAVCASVGLSAGCSATTVNVQELSCYRGDSYTSLGETDYNDNLFYDNSLIQGPADPFVLDDTAKSGYYYLYTTGLDYKCWRSKNLAVWEEVGRWMTKEMTSEEKRVLASNQWAPEAAYDEERGLYYMFFSATPTRDTSFEGPGLAKTDNYSLFVAVSENAVGPFRLVNFGDANSCGKDAVRSFNTDCNKVISEAEAKSGKVAFNKVGDTYYEAAFPNYYAQYCYLAPDGLSKLMQKNGVGTGGRTTPDARYWGCIDPSPFVDPVTHEKYIYFKIEIPTGNAIIAVQMKNKNWLTPDWEHAELCTISDYYTIQDWRDNVNVGVDHATANNEAPHIIYHKDKNGVGRYYLTYSTGSPADSTYRVITAVAGSPLGPYRNLYASEGAVLLSSELIDSPTVSGTGHHCFMQIGDQTFAIYHRKEFPDKYGMERYTALDELKWIAIEDSEGEYLEVPYVNGATDSIQPLPDKVTGYTNVAALATVTCDDKEVETSCVNDGLLSVLKSADEDFMNYIREAKLTKTSTFTFDFNAATDVRAVMVYNSAFETSVFRKVSKIEFTLEDGTKRVIRDLEFDLKQYCEVNEETGEIEYVMSGACVFAEFYEIKVTQIKVTVDVPNGQEKVGVSEIKILGKKA